MKKVKKEIALAVLSSTSKLEVLKSTVAIVLKVETLPVDPGQSTDFFRSWWGQQKHGLLQILPDAFLFFPQACIAQLACSRTVCTIFCLQDSKLHTCTSASKSKAKEFTQRLCKFVRTSSCIHTLSPMHMHFKFGGLGRRVEITMGAEVV